MSQTPQKSWEQDKNNYSYENIWGFSIVFLDLEPLGPAKIATSTLKR